MIAKNEQLENLKAKRSELENKVRLIFEEFCDLKEFLIQQKNLCLIFQSFFHHIKEDLYFDLFHQHDPYFQ